MNIPDFHLNDISCQFVGFNARLIRGYLVPLVHAVDFTVNRSWQVTPRLEFPGTVALGTLKPFSNAPFQHIFSSSGSPKGSQPKTNIRIVSLLSG